MRIGRESLGIACIRKVTRAGVGEGEYDVGGDQVVGRRKPAMRQQESPCCLMLVLRD